MAQRRFRPINYPTSGGSAWGAITGTLSDQTDLQAELDLKADLTGATFTGAVTATNLNISNWDTAYGWGDHSTAGYVKFGESPVSNTPDNYVYFNRSGSNPATYFLNSGTGAAIKAGVGTLGTTTFTEYVQLGRAGNHVEMVAPAPKLKWNETDATTNEKIWDVVPVSGLLRFRCINDAESTSTDWMNVNRAGQSPDLIHFMNTDNVQVNNRLVVTAALDGTSYYGLHVNGADNGWIRTTSLGFIPHTSGGSGSLGTAAWPFSAIYGNNVQADNFFRADNANIEGSIGTFSSDVLHYGLAMRGAGFDATSSAYTGYCRIAFPANTTGDSVMFTAMIHGYNYYGTRGQYDGGHWCIAVSGYFYSSENWANTSARIVTGSPPFDRVLFGEASDAKKYIMLGTTSTNWNYPKVWITDATFGHSTQDDWTAGDWNISFSTAAPTGWSQDASSSPVYIGGQIRWDGENGSNAANKSFGGRITISTSAASGGYDGDIHFKY